MNLVISFVFGVVVIGLLFVLAFMLLGMRLIKGGATEEQEAERREEARLIQEMYQGLSRMEDRIDALETLLLDKEKKEETHEL